jgi:ribonuclease P/MRP protein subunit POP5
MIKMKLKILPPTLREKKRYIGLKIYSSTKLKREEIFSILWNSIINIYGEIESSKINLWIVESKEVPNPQRFQYNAIVKCQRGYETELITAISSIYRYKKERIVVHSIGTSGTIKSLKKKYHLF